MSTSKMVYRETTHEGMSCYRIETSNAVYVFDRDGGGFASLFDRDGNDWISFRPGGGSAGNFRGIPNLVHPEGYFHPGEGGCRSTLERVSGSHLTIQSTSKDDAWAGRWDIFPNHARFTVLKAPKPYWFLYEGTPGGKLDQAEQRFIRSDQSTGFLAEKWACAEADSSWIAFADATLNRSLLLLKHDAEERRDSYWPMENNMTVFGFGRDGLEKFLTKTPASYSIALVEGATFALLRERAEKILKEQ